MDHKKVIGIIKYFDNNEIMQYIDEEEFIKDFKDTLYNYGISGWYYEVYNLELQTKCSKILADEFGYVEQ